MKGIDAEEKNQMLTCSSLLVSAILKGKKDIYKSESLREEKKRKQQINRDEDGGGLKEGKRNEGWTGGGSR